MAERETTWRWSSNYVQLGEDGLTFVPEDAHVVGIGLRGAPDLEARFEVRDGVPECVEFSLRSQAGGRAVRSADLRLFDIDGFTFNTFMRYTKRALPGEQRRPQAAQLAPYAHKDEREWWAAAHDFGDAQRHRKSANQAELEEVARIYRENVDGKPTAAVQVGMNYSVRTSARRVKQAEEAGLLPTTTRGKKRI